MPRIDLSTLSPSSFPSDEDDAFEFKSSLASAKAIGDKLNEAVSAFGNSGGGCFIWGVDKHGNPDSGVDKLVGRQPIRDWLDQIVSRVAPTPICDYEFYDDPEGRGTLDADKVIVAVAVRPSELAPHMANDSRYYIRAGAHTVPAGNYIVESLWARRHYTKPVVSHVLRRKRGHSSVIQIGVVVLTDAPALNVRVSISPLKGLLADLERHMPMRVPVIDRSNPFFFDATAAGYVQTELSDDVKLLVEYDDLAGHHYQYESDAPLPSGLGPINFGVDREQEIVRGLGEIDKKLQKIADACAKRN